MPLVAFKCAYLYQRIPVKCNGASVKFELKCRASNLKKIGKATRYVHNALGQRLFKTEPLFAPVSSGSNPADPGVIQTLLNFFGSLWGGSANTAAPSASEKLGFTYYYGEDASLLYEQGSGGANSTGSSHYVYLPTPAGPMPIAAFTGNRHYAVHTDHLNTPRRLTQSNKQVAWQWAFSAFGDEQPTIARNRFADPTTIPNAGTTTVAEVTFNLRYPGQYFDKESNLHYNYFRSYDAKTGRYTQADPIGLDGGWNRFGYAEQNPLMYTDPTGLIVFIPPVIVWGVPIVAGAWWAATHPISGPTYAKPPDNAYDPNGPKAPGQPGPENGYFPPKGGPNWVPNPNPGSGGSGYGWEDKKGDVWCPTGQGGRSHSGPHWDVQTPGGGYRNEKPKR